MSDTSKIQPYSLPAEFVRQWNDAADDNLITAGEYRAIQEVAKASETTEDDRFFSDLNSGHDLYMDLDAIRRRQAQLESVASAARDAGLLFSDIEISYSDTNGFHRWTEYRRKTEGSFSIYPRVDKYGERRAGVNGGAIGYSSQTVRVGDASFGRFHGVHVDTSLSHPLLTFGLLHASLRVEADLGFGKDGAILVAGAGPMIHLGAPGLVQLYGGVLTNGMVGSVGDAGRAGWAVNATAGGQLLIFYAEVDYPVTGGDTNPEGCSIGARFGF